MEAELEDERKAKSTAVAARRQLEGDVKELESQLDQANRIKEDGLKQLKKYQNQLKDVQRDLEDSRHSRDDLAAQVSFYFILSFLRYIFKRFTFHCYSFTNL